MRLVFVASTLVLSGCLLLTTHDDPWPCDTDADCRDGLRCRDLFSDNGKKRCLPPRACDNSGDCSDVGQYWECASKTCVPPECTKDSECSEYRCVNHRCGTSCVDGSDCAAGHGCVGGGCTRLTCENGPDPVCRGYVCKEGICPLSCEQSSDCTPGFTCNSDKQCVCSDNEPCGAYACNLGRCLTTCIANNNCATGYTCSNSKCRRCSGTPAACTAQPNCIAKGCGIGNGCTGGPINCHMMDFSFYACRDTVGCTWEGSSNRCSGTASCSAQNTQLCPSPCRVDGTCGGTPAPCETHPPDECLLTVGCTLQ